MKKEDIFSLVAYLLMLAIALVVGLAVIRPAFGALAMPNWVNPIVLVIISIILGLIVNSLGLEAGHAIGAKIGGYSVVSFNVLYFCFYKDNKKTKFRFKSYDGLTGETNITPTKNAANPKYFVWIPVILFVIEVAVTVTLYILARSMNNPVMSVFGLASIVFLALGAMIAVYNIFPTRLDSMNDGYRLVLFSKPINVEAFNELARVEEMQRNGEEVEEIKFFDEITDYTASLNLTYVYDFLAKKDYDSAIECIDKILVDPSKVSNQTYCRLVAQKIYIKLMNEPLESAKEYYEKEISEEAKRYISNDLSMESLRAYVLVAGLIEESKGELQYANSRKAKALKRMPESRMEIEDGLYKEAIDKVLKEHSDWDLSIG